MMKNLRFFLILISIFCVPLSVFSDTVSTGESIGSLVFASGEGFQVIRGGAAEEYEPDMVSAEGLEFYPGDYINTYADTFIEIELSETGHLLKISENTSFFFQDAEQKKVYRFAISYGRVRARVKKLAGLERFSIDGPSVVAGVRGTDFGYDVLYGSDSALPVSSVYCFDGEIAVRPKVEIGETSGIGQKDVEELRESPGNSLLLLADEMITVEGRRQENEEVFHFTKSPVRTDIEFFWDRNPFSTDRVEVEPEQMPKPVALIPDKEESEYSKAQLRKGGFVTGAIGVSFGAAALTFLYADSLLTDVDQDLRDNLALGTGFAGGLFISTSLMLFLGSVFSE